MEHQGRSLKWLATRTGYTHSYVRSVKSGFFPVTEEFKRKCEFAMDLPIEVLFSLPECSDNRTMTTAI